ncbi:MULTISPECIES: pantetheine-phosphate adenylyltransferase [Lactobacillus]|uniref:pantetheine-phosphate adenylyltransferase n=1 Tax=Lactobacillus TaxID=1578 RepID=UPI0024912E02|nr:MULTISPECIES: pantetheine-phosphate adenylyltransferase [Lactobacillus]
MTIALFPGSFDPITNGHLDVAKKAATMFDKVYVVIMTNTNKHYLFNSQERTQMAQEALKDIPNIEVLAKPDQLTVDVARHLKASAIIRGVRNTEDFLYEQQIAGINERLNDQVHTVLLFTDPENSFVASSMIKEVARFNGDIEQFLPANVADALKKKLR